MAQKYTDAFIRAVAEGRAKAPTAYVQRVANSYKRDSSVSRSQAGGHPNIKKGEKPVSQIRPSKSKSTGVKPPKITQRSVRTPRGGKVVTTRSTQNVFNQMKTRVRNNSKARVYFRVWDRQKGQYVDVYRGSRNTPHGITINEFITRVQDKLSSGSALTTDEAIRDTISGDSADSGGTDSPGGEEAPYDFAQIEAYFLPY